MKRILIIGATSGIAQAVSRIYARENSRLVLLGRDADKLTLLSGDLVARGATSVDTFVVDVNDSAKMSSTLDAVWRASEIDLAIIAHGSLPNQERSQEDLDYLVREFRINAESAITCLTALALRFGRQRYGVIAMIGSVAGDRGRESNHLYGSAKAAVETFVSGFRVRMSRLGVHVLLVKPGFVRTRMTRHLSLPGVLVASADQVAADITEAIQRKRELIYTPWFWRWIMFLIVNIPSFIFKRIRL